MNVLRMGRWSPYAVGAGIGALSWATFALMHKALGTSTTMVCAAGAIERAVAPGHADSNAYLAKQIGTVEAPKAIVDWQFALVIMLAVGAFIAARLARSTFKEVVPEVWSRRFGDGRLLRFSAAFIGGMVLLFGARMAGGCTSGHGISGGLQLAVSSWTFFGAMFVSGVATAMLVYGRRSGNAIDRINDGEVTNG